MNTRYLLYVFIYNFFRLRLRWQIIVEGLHFWFLFSVDFYMNIVQLVWVRRTNVYQTYTATHFLCLQSTLLHIRTQVYIILPIFVLTIISVRQSQPYCFSCVSNFHTHAHVTFVCITYHSEMSKHSNLFQCVYNVHTVNNKCRKYPIHHYQRMFLCIREWFNFISYVIAYQNHSRFERLVV